MLDETVSNQSLKHRSQRWKRSAALFLNVSSNKNYALFVKISVHYQSNFSLLNLSVILFYNPLIIKPRVNKAMLCHVLLLRRTLGINIP